MLAVALFAHGGPQNAADWQRWRYGSGGGARGSSCSSSRVVLHVAVSVLLVLSVTAAPSREKLLSFELSPPPSPEKAPPPGGLQKYWFLLNDDDRPFSMEPNGNIQLDILSLVFDVNGYREYIENFVSLLEKDNSSYYATYFMKWQPRLNNLYAAMKLSGNCSNSISPEYNTNLSSVIDADFMALDARVILKVFSLRDWRRMMQDARTGQNALIGADIRKHDSYSETPEDLSAQEALKICRVPALYSVYLDTGGRRRFPGIVWGGQHQTHLVVVIAQCSHIPLSLGVALHLSNVGGKGSADYISVESVYLFFLIAYIMVFGIILLLVLPCGHSFVPQPERNQPRSSDEGGIRVTDPRGGGSNATSNSGTDEKPVNTEKLENNQPRRSRFDGLWDGDESEESSKMVGKQTSCFCGNLFRTVRRFCGQQLLLLYPTLQWVLLACILIKVVLCVLRLTQYKLAGESAMAIRNSSIDILVIVLTVCTRSAFFTMQQFVCVGWGCAYVKPPTAKIVSASLASITAFSIYVLSSTCEGSTTVKTLTVLNDVGHVNLRCISIGMTMHALEVLGSMLNIFQLTALTATIGRAASTGMAQGKARVFIDKTSLYLRYRGMCLPYTIGILMPQIVYVVFSMTLMEFDDHYLEVGVEEFVQWYAAVFFLLFLRKDPLYL